MKFCLADFETASTCDLKKSGAWAYAADPTTEILCLGFTIDGAEPEVFQPGTYVGDRTPTAYRLSAAVENPAVIFIAHNVPFEKAIWREIMVNQLGWPDIPDGRWHDTMAVCAMKGLPLDFGRAAHILQLDAEKDTEGRKVTLAMSRMSRSGFFIRTPEQMARVFSYNRDDVLGELALHRRVRGLGAQERKVWLLDQRINQRGVYLDREYITAAVDVCNQATAPLLKRFTKITGIDKIGSPKFKDWLIENGTVFPVGPDGEPDTSLDKEHMSALLGEDDDEDDGSLAGDAADDEEVSEIVVPDICREALKIKGVAASASIKKLPAMLACIGTDGRARGLAQYHGAGPGRWSGRLFQPHNFPRGKLKFEHDPQELVDAIMTRDAEYVRMLFGEPIAAVATGLRHAIMAAPGHRLEVGDFAAIEARVVLAIAGAERALAVLRDKDRDVYCEMAATIFGVPAPKGKAEIKVFKTEKLELRQTGKSTILGCGFGMGPPKFRMRYAKDKPIEFARRCIVAYREDFAPEVPDLWRALEGAAIRTVWDRTPHEAYGIVYALEDGWLTARLHNGKKLWYYDPRPCRKAMPWDKDDVRPGFTYGAWKLGRWVRVDAYGGLLTENVVQATARELLVHAMFNCEAAFDPTILTVHDEIMNEPLEKDADMKRLEHMMCDIPEWAKTLGVPVDAECWTGERYKK